MLRLELALDDFVSRALADDDVRKAMESATAEGYSGPALQAVLLLMKKRGFETNKATFFWGEIQGIKEFFSCRQYEVSDETSELSPIVGSKNHHRRLPSGYLT